MTTSAASEAPWTEYVGAILRSWRFIVLGVLAAWAMIAAAALLIPRDYLVVAAVSLPDLIVPREVVDENRIKVEERKSSPLAFYDRLDRGDTWRRTGVPIAFYKEMEKVLSDPVVVAANLKDRLRTADVGPLVQGFEFGVLTTNPRDELPRIERADGITGVVVTAATRRPERAREVAEALIALVRQSFVTTLARQEIRQRMLVASRSAPQARQDYMNLAQANASLEQEARDMDRVLKEAPALRGAQPQVVVTTDDRSRVYASPASQLLGVRAVIAENAHLMRTFQREAAIQELRVAFLRRIDARLGEQAAAGGAAATADVPAVLRSELDAFLKDKSGEEADFLKADMAGLADTLESAAQSARTVQSASVQRKPRANRTVGAMAVVVVLFVAAALVRESWRRRHAELVARAPRDAA